MPEEEITSIEEGNDGNASAEHSKTFTQEDVNRLLAKEKSKYKGFSEMKDKAAKYDNLQKESMSDLEKLNARAEAAEQERDKLKAERDRDLWRKEVSEATGVPADVLRGENKEEIEQHAETLKPHFAKDSAPVVETGAASETGSEASGDWLRDAINGN